MRNKLAPLPRSDMPDCMARRVLDAVLILLHHHPDKRVSGAYVWQVLPLLRALNAPWEGAYAEVLGDEPESAAETPTQNPHHEQEKVSSLAVRNAKRKSAQGSEGAGQADWHAMEQNFLDKVDAANNTACALTKAGLSFVAAKNLHR